MIDNLIWKQHNISIFFFTKRFQLFTWVRYPLFIWYVSYKIANLTNTNLGFGGWMEYVTWFIILSIFLRKQLIYYGWFQPKIVVNWESNFICHQNQQFMRTSRFLGNTDSLTNYVLCKLVRTCFSMRNYYLNSTSN